MDMTKLVKEKIKILRELGYHLTKAQLKNLHSCATEYQLDRVAHDIIFR